MRKQLIILREKRGLTRKQMAEKLAVSVSFYGKIERGDRNPVLETAKQIADIVGAKSVDEIFFNKQCGVMSRNKKII